MFYTHIIYTCCSRVFFLHFFTIFFIFIFILFNEWSLKYMYLHPSVIYRTLFFFLSFLLLLLMMVVCQSQWISCVYSSHFVNQFICWWKKMLDVKKYLQKSGWSLWLRTYEFSAIIWKLKINLICFCREWRNAPFFREKTISKGR